MCWIYHAPWIMRCGHRIDHSDQVQDCLKDPCVTGGKPQNVFLGSTMMKDPCEDCKAKGYWVKVPGTANQWMEADENNAQKDEKA